MSLKQANYHFSCSLNERTGLKQARDRLMASLKSFLLQVANFPFVSLNLNTRGQMRDQMLLLISNKIK